RGVSYIQLNELDAAIADLRKAVELDPKLSAAWTDLSLALARNSDLPGAIEAATRAIELDGRHPRAWITRGHARRVLRQHAAAFADFTRALDLDPAGAGDAWFGRGECRFALGDPGAIPDLEMAVGLLRPDESMRAIALIYLGRLRAR
ncbi:MAG: tetratricopeptide repeat protein, partial [Planctomycetota bacterium]